MTIKKTQNSVDIAKTAANSSLKMKMLFVHKKGLAKPEAAKPGIKLMRFDAAIDLSGKAGTKSNVTYREVKDGDRVVDYLDVKIDGYLSTFQNFTPKDRQGDYVVRGAFLEDIPQFMRNPIILVNHDNRVTSAAGKFTLVEEDNIGLHINGLLSNAPDMAPVRYRVVDGTIRTLSMGGYFIYDSDGRGILKVKLYEGSLVAVPANPDALFTVREATPDERKLWRA